MYRDLREKNEVLQDVIANDQQNVAVRWNNKPDMAGCELVSGNYFEPSASVRQWDACSCLPTKHRTPIS